ncbi:MAG: septum site-determining protein MinC [Pseudomonadota bacterium]|nr:septum site-determining protein MinC [Pseudomonadota bacterium]
MQKSPPTAFGLKGNLLTLTVMQLQTADTVAIREQLQTTVAATPKFFLNMPIVVDLQFLHEQANVINFSELNALLREHGLMPVGISNGNEQQQQDANGAGLGTLSQIKKQASIENTAPEKKTSAPIRNPAKIIRAPVRSGQHIYAEGADLIILASVSAGAEVLADGHIHIYGPLRGRALAGVQGDQSAQIFCCGLQAELVSIAGQYKLQDSIFVTNPSHTANVYIEDGQMQIKELL